MTNKSARRKQTHNKAKSIAQRLADLRTIFLADASQFPGITCIVVHQDERDAQWSVGSGPLFGIPQDDGKYSPTAWRYHRFLQDVPQEHARTYRDMERVFSRQKKDRQTADDALEKFRLHCRQQRVAELLLGTKWMPAELNHDVRHDHVWLWTLAEMVEKRFWVTLPYRGDNNDEGKRVAFHQANKAELPFPMTVAQLAAQREILRDSPSPWQRQLADLLPNYLPRSFFCHIPDIFQASVDLVSMLAADSKTDTKTDTEKKSAKKRRTITKEATACARTYKKAIREGAKVPMKQVVSEYVEARGGSRHSILRTLQDNPEIWK